MRDIASDLERWWSAGRTFSVATVIDVYDSAPRQPGAAMAVDADGVVVGSVSGGCVEGAVYEVAQESIRTGAPQRVRYGISDDEALAVGLTCGGEIDLLVEPVSTEHVPFFGDVIASIGAEEPVAVATVVSGPAPLGAKLAVWRDRTEGSLGSEGLDVGAGDDARGMLAQGCTGIRSYGAHGERRMDDVEVFVASFAPRPRMLVFGAIDFARAVTQVGHFLGYRVTVCDAREVFATPRRFPDADEVVVEWPHRYLERADVDNQTVICVLTHDPKFDVPVLEFALRTDAAYIGAMGSRRTHEDRLARLRERGVTDKELERLSSPIGLDIGARTPEETAVSIAAEIIQSRWGGTGQPLGVTSGRIHHSGPR